MSDLLIRHALLYDGSGRAGVPGDVLVRGDTIAAVASAGTLPPSVAERLIEARGLALAPGFVDIHGHSDYHLFVTPQASSALAQGVTTEIGGNCGYSAAPVRGPLAEERREGYRTWLGLECPWETVNEYLDAIARLPLGMNFGLYVGHNTVRASVMGSGDREATPAERSAMAEEVRQGVADGAFGLSTGLIYAPACFADTGELIDLARSAAEKGGIFAVHMRDEGPGVVESVEEALTVAAAARIPLEISHLKTSGRANWSKIGDVLERIEEARTRGVAVHADRYPYTASNTGLQAVLPHWALAGAPAEKMARLTHAETRVRIAEETRAHYAPGYFDSVVISEVTSAAHRRFEGHSVAACAAEAGSDPVAWVLDLLAAENFAVMAIYHTMSEENLRTILARDYVMIGSDSGCRDTSGPLSTGRPHPRTFGTFPRVLARYVRDEGLLTLPEAIRKMTGEPCRKLGIARRGLLRAGFYADLVLFDPDRVRDTATYDAPFQFPEGIRVVIVNGEIALKDGALTGVSAGRPLRRGDT